MTLSDISIRKPVFAWMLMVGLLVFGAISFSRMGISQLPDVDFPVVNVSISWVGASPETMELAVTDAVEDAVMSVEGVRSVSSTCQEGISNTSIEFELNRNVDVALQEVQTKLSQAQKRLPTDIDPPIVTKSNPEDQPIVWTALTGGTLREKVLFARDRLKDQLTTVSGVGDVRMGGYVDPNMRIWLDTDKMRTRQIAVEDVSSAVKAGSTIVPSGYLESGAKETNLRVMSEAMTPEDFGKLIIPSRGGSPIWSQIRINDIGRVEEGLADVRRISRLNRVSAVGLGVIKQRGSNAVGVGHAVKERVRYLKTMLPSGMDLVPVNDSTRFIEASTRELLFTLGLSAILTSIVCWLFLGSLSSAFNVVLAIPVSLIGSFIVLNACGFTINTFTLLALSLSIGIVVDDAIMVLENIVRYFERGMGRVKASLVGAREITGAAVAASVAILAIFLPVIFMKGIIGKFFFQFGVAMSVAVSISLLEALTLAPMRCSQFLQPVHQGGNRVTAAVDRFMNSLVERYRGLLARSLRHRWKVIVGAVAAFAVSLLLLKGIKQEFVPPQDQSRFLISMQTPMGSSLDFTDQTFKKAEKVILDRPEIESVFVAVGGFQGGLVNQGNLFVSLKEPGSRGVHPPFKHEPSQQELMGMIRGQLKEIPGVKRASMIDLSQTGFSSSRGFPIQFSVQGPDWKKLSEVALAMMERLKNSGLVQDVDTDYNPNMPEAQIFPDHAKAEARGVTISNIANTISAMVGSLQVGKYTDVSGHRNDVRLKLEGQFNQNAKDVTRIWVRNNHGEMVPLSEVVEVKDASTLLTISRYNRERSVTVFANPVPGKDMQAAMDHISALSKEMLPAGYHITLTGNSQAFKESFESLIFALILGIFVAYMVLGAQFNSFIHPFTVLLALPFSVIGAFGALYIADISLNIYSMIGMLLLMGIVKKNSILLVDFTNHRRAEGATVQDALLEACPLRLRPILMTSIATVAAAIPAAIALGPGAETTRPMAVVVIGGVLTSTLLTLIVVPCAYSLLARLERPRHERELKQALTELGET